MTRTLSLAVLLILSGCKDTPPPSTAAPSNLDADTELEALRTQQKTAGEFGTLAGSLKEREGDLLLKRGRKEAAAAAYDAAARMYAQSPEATTEPVTRAAQARQKAADARK